MELMVRIILVIYFEIFLFHWSMTIKGLVNVELGGKIGHSIIFQQIHNKVNDIKV